MCIRDRDEVLTDDWQEILDDPKISIVIELMGGIEPARTYILEALKAGKNVVTANKDLLAEHGKELMDAAEEYHKDLYLSLIHIFLPDSSSLRPKNALWEEDCASFWFCSSWVFCSSSSIRLAAASICALRP